MDSLAMRPAQRCRGVQDVFRIGAGTADILQRGFRQRGDFPGGFLQQPQPPIQRAAFAHQTIQRIAQSLFHFAQADLHGRGRNLNRAETFYFQ